MQCHTIKIAQKLSIYSRFKNSSSNELNVSDNQTGVPRCVVPLHTSGIGPTCMERCEPYNCSVVNSIRNAAGQVWFSLVCLGNSVSLAQMSGGNVPSTPVLSLRTTKDKDNIPEQLDCASRPVWCSGPL